MDLVYVGKIVNTHGIKGELRIRSDFERKDLVFKVGNKIIIDKEEHIIKSYRYHKIFDMITIKGYNDINQVLKYKGEYVFVNREDIILNENEYLDEDIIGLRVMVDGVEIGQVIRIEDHNKNRVLVVKNTTKNYLIPYNFDIIKEIDISKKEMKVLNISGLF